MFKTKLVKSSEIDTSLAGAMNEIEADGFSDLSLDPLPNGDIIVIGHKPNGPSPELVQEAISKVLVELANRYVEKICLKAGADTNASVAEVIRNIPEAVNKDDSPIDMLQSIHKAMKKLRDEHKETHVSKEFSEDDCEYVALLEGVINAVDNKLRMNAN